MKPMNYLYFRSLLLLIIQDLGHGDAVKEIITFLPKQRRTGLFSATEATVFTPSFLYIFQSVSSLSQAGLRNPVNIKLEIKRKDGNKQAVPLTLNNEYVICENDEKIQVVCDSNLFSIWLQLYKFINDHPESKIIVFFLTCASVDFYHMAFQYINPNHLLILNIHGRMIQKRREKTMEKFRNAQRISLSPTLLLQMVFCSLLIWQLVVLIFPMLITSFNSLPLRILPSLFIVSVEQLVLVSFLLSLLSLGRCGHSLLFLAPSESAYLPFIQKRGVPMKEYNENETTEERHANSVKLLDTIKEHVRHEREIMEAGRVAFVADIRVSFFFLVLYVGLS